jgi:HprK-related kinase A
MTELVGDIPIPRLREQLADGGLGFDLGAARVRVRSDVPQLADAVSSVYRHFPIEKPEGFFDVTIEVQRVSGLRRHFHPQIRFVVDGDAPFEPFPATVHLPLMEWGMNFALTERCLHYLLLHSGSVERDGVGIVLPAIPGSGKSTLTAALVSSGRYRLLSDEFGVLSLESGRLLPMLRPIALKNASIDVIRRRFPDAVIGPVFLATRKGDVAHVAPRPASVEARRRSVQPGIVLFPQFEAGAPARLETIDPTLAFSKLTVNSFNYELLGAPAFDLVARMVGSCTLRRLVFGNLGEAIDVIDRLVADRVAGLPDRID